MICRSELGEMVIAAKIGRDLGHDVAKPTRNQAAPVDVFQPRGYAASCTVGDATARLTGVRYPRLIGNAVFL